VLVGELVALDVVGAVGGDVLIGVEAGFDDAVLDVEGFPDADAVKFDDAPSDSGVVGSPHFEAAVVNVPP
jgi:hypothetical protein